MIILIAGGVLVAVLLVWALTRTVEPESVMTTDTGAATSTFTPADTAGTLAPPPSAGTFATNETTATAPPATASAPVATPAQPEGNRAEVKRISAEDLRAQVSRGAVTVIDVRTAADYARGHIPGAINIPFASIETQLDTIPKDKPIVTYCT